MLLLHNSEPVTIRSASVSPDGRTLQAEYVRPGDLCGGKLVVDSSVTDRRVTVTVSIERGLDLTTRNCALHQKIERTSVHLDSPLGSRTVVDGATGEQIPVTRS